MLRAWVSLTVREPLNIHRLILCCVAQTQVCRPGDTDSAHKWYLKLQWHNPKVQNLSSWPKDIVGSKRRNIDVLELLDQVLLSTSFSYRHKGEKGSQTARSKEKLIHGHTLKSRNGASLRCNWEPLAEQAVPFEL